MEKPFPLIQQRDSMQCGMFNYDMYLLGEEIPNGVHI